MDSIKLDMIKQLNIEMEVNYGNAYHVANSNWYGIHNPITVDMLKSGEIFLKIYKTMMYIIIVHQTRIIRKQEIFII